MSLVSTLGQRQFLIKSRTQINIHQFSGKTTPTQYKDKQDATHPGRGLTPRMDWAAGLFPGSFPDVRIRRTRMPVGRTSPSTRLGRQYERPVDVPVGDSDRDVAQPRSGWLSSRSPTTASTRLQRRPTVPVPVSSRGPMQHPVFSSNSELEPQFPADSGGSTHDAKLHFANQSHSEIRAFSSTV